MASTTAAGTAIAISAGSPAVQTAAAYGALSYTDIGNVESIGGFGAATEVVGFQPLKGPMQKHKGPTNYGSLTPTMAVDEADAGQALLAVASAPSNSALYAIRVTKPDGSLRYFQVRVFGMPETIGAANTMITAAPVLEINTAIVKVGSSAAPAPTLTMTQLASANRIYQRSTTTGGGQGKGTGSIPVTLSASGAGSLFARTRAVSGGAVLQPAFAAGSVSSGTQTVTVAGIDARLGWFYLDLSTDGVTWQNGTTPVGMGRLTLLSGQSQAARQFFKVPAYTGTMASLGVTIDPNTSVFARYSEAGRVVTDPTWQVPADGGDYDSTFPAEFLRRQAALFGVNCGLIGHAVGNTVISAWQPGQQNNTDLRGVLTAAGGFEAAYFHLGGSDAGAGTTNAAFQTGLTGVFNDYAGYNAARGTSFEKYVTAMATRVAAGSGTASQVQTIRRAASAWAAANGATYLEPHDVNLEDEVHQGQPGSIVLARHLHRATSPATDNGPTITAATRTGTAIKLTTSAAVTLVGDVKDRFQVYPAGTNTSALAIASATVAGGAITVTLTADPGSAQALDVYWLRHPDPSGTGAAANTLHDGYTADGIPTGRQVAPTHFPVTAAAPGGTPTPSPTPTPAFRDTFTDTAGVSLASHTSETGATWTVPAGTLTISSAGTVIGAAASNGMSSFDPGSTASYVEGSFVYNGGALNSMFMAARMIDTGNFYVFGIEAGAGYTIGKFVNGTFTRLVQQTGVSFTAGQTYVIRGELDGSTLRLIVDGVQAVTATDTSLPNSGKVGVRVSATASTATSGTALTEMKAGAL